MRYADFITDSAPACLVCESRLCGYAVKGPAIDEASHLVAQCGCCHATEWVARVHENANSTITVQTIRTLHETKRKAYAVLGAAAFAAYESAIAAL